MCCEQKSKYNAIARIDYTRYILDWLVGCLFTLKSDEAERKRMCVMFGSLSILGHLNNDIYTIGFIE